MVVGQGLTLSIIGLGLGLPTAFALTRAFTTILVGVKHSDPLTYTMMALLFIVITALASWLPAHRAASLYPTVALDEE